MLTKSDLVAVGDISKFAAERANAEKRNQEIDHRSDCSVGNDPEMLSEVIQDFIVYAEAGIVKIRAAIARGDVERLKTTAHRLKGSASLVGANHLLEGLYSIRNCGQRDRLANDPSIDVSPRCTVAPYQEIGRAPCRCSAVYLE